MANQLWFLNNILYIHNLNYCTIHCTSNTVVQYLLVPRVLNPVLGSLTSFVQEDYTCKLQWKISMLCFFMLYFQKNASKHNYHQNENITTKTKVVQMYLKSSSFLSMTLMSGKGGCLHNTVKNFNTLFFMVYVQINTYKLTFHQNEKILLLFIYQMSFFAEQLYLALALRVLASFCEKFGWVEKAFFHLKIAVLTVFSQFNNLKFVAKPAGHNVALLQWVVIEKLIWLFIYLFVYFISFATFWLLQTWTRQHLITYTCTVQGVVP